MAAASAKTNSGKKKTAAKKTQSKKTAAKKTTATAKSKSTTKKTATKKSTKAAPKAKSSAKKTAAKKTSSKKTASKSTAKKKATSKKSVAPKKASPTKKKSAAKSTTKKAAAPKSRPKPVSKPKPKKPLVPLPEFPTTSWGPDSVISFEPTEHVPPAELTCISGGIIFHEDKMVLANVPGRGWEIIGGRIDIGESPEDTFRREAMRQVGASLSHVRMLGVIRIEHQGPEPPNCPYPYPVGYGVQYIGIVDELLPFTGNEDSLGRSLITPDGVKHHYFEWSEYIDSVFTYAYDVYTKWKKKLKL